MLLYTDNSVRSDFLRLAAAAKIADLDERSIGSADAEVLHAAEGGPALDDRGVVVVDPWIIVEYLDERYPMPELFPGDPIERAHARMLMRRMADEWAPLADRVRGADSFDSAQPVRTELCEAISAHADAFPRRAFWLGDKPAAPDLLFYAVSTNASVQTDLPSEGPIGHYVARIREALDKMIGTAHRGEPVAV